LCLALFSSLVPALRTPLLNSLRYPLEFATFIRREIGALIFFHENFIQNERLKTENGFLKQRLNEITEVSQENTRLKNLLSFKQKSAYRLIAARVIGRSTDSWSSVIIIEKGSYHGIKRGMAVLGTSGLAGRVMETSDSSAKIMLINDPNLGVSAIVQRSRQEGLVSGTLSSFLIMRYLPKESDIQVGDTVITSGLTEAYPKGLMIGAVLELGEEFSGLSRYAVIKPAADLSNLEEVFVIVP